MASDLESGRNIESFNLIVGMVLADLYERFPVPRDLSGRVYAQRAGLHRDLSDIQVEDGELAGAAIQWLISEGYVRAASDVNSIGNALGCVLTLQGLRLLSMPQSLEKSESVGEALIKATTAGAQEGVKSVVGKVVKTALLEGGKLGFQLMIQSAITGAR